MSIRSSSGPESLLRYSWTRSGRHTQRRTPSPSNPQGQVRGGDEREPRRELHRTDRPRDHDTAVLERLAEALDGIASELGEFVEEQHAMMREAHSPGRTEARLPRAALPWRPNGAAPGTGGCAGDRATRPGVPRPNAAGSPPGIPARQLREDRRQPPREHRLPGAGRPHHQQVWPPAAATSRARRACV